MAHQSWRNTTPRSVDLNDDGSRNGTPPSHGHIRQLDFVQVYLKCGKLLQIKTLFDTKKDIAERLDRKVG